MENIGREVDALRKRLDQALRLMAHCRVEVPDDPQEAKELMETALDLGGMSQLVKQCSQVIERGLDAGNAIEILKFASGKGITDLVEASRTYILKDFMSVYTHEDLLSMNVEDLTWFLKHDLLNVTSEEVVLEALLRWVKHDMNRRKAHMEGLITSVRLYCCDLRFLKSLKDHYLLWNSDSFQRTLQPVIQEVESGEAVVAERAKATKRRPRLNGEPTP